MSWECAGCGRAQPGGAATCDCWRESGEPASNQQSTVDHPNHYGGDTTYETIKVIEAWGLDFHLGNAVKYISRAGKKSTTSELEDLEKARWYLDRAIGRVKDAG